nr:hypothetical protein [Tanacetum cinerariifolium]
MIKLVLGMMVQKGLNEDDKIVVKPKEVTKIVKPSFEKIESVNARNETIRQAENPRKNNKSPRVMVMGRFENRSNDESRRIVQAEYGTNDVTTDSSYQYSQVLLALNKLLLLAQISDSTVQTASGKEFLNPLIADSLLKNYMVLNSPYFTVKSWLVQSKRLLGRIDDADAEVTFIDETSNDARNKNNKISSSKRQNWRDLPMNTPLDRVEVLGMIEKISKVRIGIMPIETELVLEQFQQGVSYEVSNIRVILVSIHSDDGNPSRVNIKQLCGSNPLSWKPCQGGSSKLSLLDHSKESMLEFSSIIAGCLGGKPCCRKGNRGEIPLRGLDCDNCVWGRLSIDSPTPTEGREAASRSTKGIANHHGNGNVVVAQAKGNSNGINKNPIRCYNCQGDDHYASNCIVKPRKQDVAYLHKQMQIAQNKEAGIQLTSDEFDFMAIVDGSVESANTKFAKQSILGKPPSSRPKLYGVTPLHKFTVFPKVGETNALSNQVTSNSVPSSQEPNVVKNDNVISPGIFRMNPFKASRVDNFVPNKHVKAIIRTKLIIVSQPHVITKNDVNSQTNGFSPKDINSTTRTRRPQPRNNPKNDKQCLITVNHDVCVLNYVNDMNSRSLNKNAIVSNVGNQKKHKLKVRKPKKVGSKERLASPKPSTPRSCLRWSPTRRIFDLKEKIIETSEHVCHSDCFKGDNACTSNPQEPISKRFPNLTFSMTGGQNWFDTLLIPLLSEYKPKEKEDHGDNECDT